MRKITNAVRTFESRVIGKYVDIIGRGAAYKTLIEKGAFRGRDRKTETEFIDLRNLFEDIELYNKGEYADKYYKIKNFYDNEIYSQGNGVVYIFADAYINLIEELGLHAKMEIMREKSNID